MGTDLSLIFKREPWQWGLRGDPYLWREIKNVCVSKSLDIDDFGITKFVYEYIESVTGQPLTCDVMAYVKRFAHGGMSSGGVSGEFWISRGIPLLIENLHKVKEVIFNENYVAEKIEGKTREEALDEIKSLWKEIRRLNKTIDANWDPHNISLDFLTMECKVRYNLEYIAAAKKHFEKQGWEYELSREEKNDLKFNDRLELIKSIEVMIHKYLGPDHGKIFYFNDEKMKFKHIFSYTPHNDEKQKEAIFEGKTKSEILEGLRDIHMGMWRDSYMRCYSYDRAYWSIVIKYIDGKKKEYRVTQDFADNFNDFLELMGMSYEEEWGWDGGHD